jgi:hypothetical protein
MQKQKAKSKKRRLLAKKEGGIEKGGQAPALERH